MLHEMRNVRFEEAAARRRDTWPTSALGRSRHSTPRADCGHSLQVRNLIVKSGEADIQTIVEARFSLLRRKATCPRLLQCASMAAVLDIAAARHFPTCESSGTMMGH